MLGRLVWIALIAYVALIAYNERNLRKAYHNESTVSGKAGSGNLHRTISGVSA